MVYVFTSCTSSYITNARILAQSVKAHHPDWKFVLLFNDVTPKDINWSQEPFDEVYFSHWLPVEDYQKWVFGYSIVEFCTATKGLMSKVLLQRTDASYVVYLDPDTVVFSPLKEIDTLMETHDVILTPHLTDREYTKESIANHEIAALKHGTFNLGFFVIKNSENGMAYVNWWSERLRDYSYIDFSRGLFTDQKWCNLAPYLFEGIYVLLDRSYNVATWNMQNRKVTKGEDAVWKVNGQPLRFYHFSGFGNDFAWADHELTLFVDSDEQLVELWNWYKQEFKDKKYNFEDMWFWGMFYNGVPIQQEHRSVYLENSLLKFRFPNPYTDEAFSEIGKSLRQSNG